MKNFINTILSGLDRIAGLSEWFNVTLPSIYDECICMQDGCQPMEACCCCCECSC